MVGLGLGLGLIVLKTPAPPSLTSPSLTLTLTLALALTLTLALALAVTLTLALTLTRTLAPTRTMGGADGRLGGAGRRAPLDGGVAQLPSRHRVRAGRAVYGRGGGLGAPMPDLVGSQP